MAQPCKKRSEGRKKWEKGLDNSGNIEGNSNGISGEQRTYAIDSCLVPAPLDLHLDPRALDSQGIRMCNDVDSFVGPRRRHPGHVLAHPTQETGHKLTVNICIRLTSFQMRIYILLKVKERLNASKRRSNNG